MAGVLIFASSRAPELRHEVPLAVPDPIVYLEQDGRRVVCAPALELPRLAELDGLELVSFTELGSDELLERGLVASARRRELVLRACHHVGLTDAVTPGSFPLAVADRLREAGVTLRPDDELFAARRRRKNAAELAGIRRAQAGVEAALAAVTARLAAGPPVTCEDLRLEATRALGEGGVLAPDLLIASHGAQTAIGHHPGAGPIAPGESVVVDLAPMDPLSGCHADTTRTFCIGDPPAELVGYHDLCLEALRRSVAAVRPGLATRELYGIAAGVFEAAGYPTDRTKPSGSVLEDGFYHSLGHGVGLEVHERPSIGRAGEDRLLPGDVLAIEPGCYRKGFGGCRLEDVVLVTDDGCEVLTSYPHGLTP